MRRLILLFCVLLIYSTLTGQDIVRAEYFIDQDPGVGYATAIPIVPGQEVELNFVANTEGLENGFHSLYVRSKDEDGVWSTVVRRAFFMGNFPYDPPQELSAAEYFINEDPGYGQGIPLQFDPNVGPAQVQFEADLSVFQPGMNTLSVRALDGKGGWSGTFSKSFFKVKLISDPFPDLVQAEYFFDEDPGFGLATPLVIDQDFSANIEALIPLENLNPGWRTLFVRAKEETGRWSTTFSHTFLKLILLTDPNSEIVAAEYYFDDDPGFGSGLSLPLDPASVATIETIIPLDDVNYGWRTLYVRTRDDNGKWSLSYSGTFLKQLLPDDPVSLSCMEYFIDEDPGYGNGIPVEIISGQDVEQFFIVDPELLIPGTYMLYVRARDDRGGWSIVFNSEFEIEAPPDCPPPSSLYATGITTDAAMLNWTPEGDETVWDILWGESGFDPENAGMLIETVMQNPYLLEGLEPSTSYDFYVRAVCDVGYYSAWAGPLTFSTQEEPIITIPTVLTAEVTQITQTTAISGGDVTNDGGMPVTARGVVWSTVENPTVEINEGITYDETGTGVFISNLTGLIPETSHFVKAYATNSEGTAYGQQFQFTTTGTEIPDWQPVPNLQYNMQIIGQLQYEDGEISLNGNDIIGAFVGEECRGVMSPDPNFMGILFLTVGSDQQSGETVTFKAYLSDENEIVELNQTLTFENQLQTGSIANPYIFNYHSTGPPNWEPNPYLQYNMQIIGQLEYEDGNISMNGNDIIGAFVGEECRGVMSPDPGFMGIIFLTVGSDQQTGEAITFKAYLADEDRIVELNESVMFENQQQIGSIPDPFIFSYGDLISHTINLPSGWSGLSSYLIPAQPALEDVFAPIANELIIAQTMTGMYYPGQNINNIGNWESHSAYKVKTNAACMLEITGEYETNLAVQLTAGWNLLSVVTPDGADPVDLFMPVNGFVIAKDVAGTGVYWPQYNINSVGYLFPGKAYYVLMTAPAVVDYTGMKSSGNLSGFLLEASLGKNLTGLEGLVITSTPFTHTIAILPQALKGFERGTLIGAYDQSGNCFGATVYNSETISLTVFGDDPTTAEKDGFFDGEIIFFKNLTGFGNLTGLNPTFDPQLPSADGLFTENGLSVITGFESATGIGYEGFGTTICIYPNPTDGLLNITGLEPSAEMTLTDLKGQLVLKQQNHSSQLMTIDLSDHQPGVYFIKVEHNGEIIYRKLVLR